MNFLPSAVKNEERLARFLQKKLNFTTSGSIMEVKCCPCRKMVGVRREDITGCWRSLEKYTILMS